VTVDDIAARAGVGTGTLYLHWRTKEALFESVLLRELHAMWGELAARLRADPSEARLPRLLAALLGAVRQRPLARALFTRDAAVLGKLARVTPGAERRPFPDAAELIGVFRAAGLVRSDADPVAQAYAFGAVWTGFVLVEGFLPPEDRPALAVELDALAETVRRAFEPAVLPAAATLRDTAAPRVIALLEEVRAEAERQLAARRLA
jgi:AcrR family transcriptional regulator